MTGQRLNLHAEVRQKSNCSSSQSEIEKIVQKYLTDGNEFVLDALIRDVQPTKIEYLRLCCNSGDRLKVDFSSEEVDTKYHVYQTWHEGPQVESLDEEDTEVPASLNWCLPNEAFEGLWESLVLENGVKEQLMNYVETTLLYSCKRVNPQLVHWNSVVLLHGPPGTGKTSLCKGLAQKLSIRLNSTFRTCQLIEINTHSLFSKWFSESAKLVLKMFTAVKEWLESSDHFACVLIDEVESLTHMRQASGLEPSDSIRVVNAVLTQIDQLQRYPNVLILATSNVTKTIDVAFADRADLKLYIPYPSQWGVYEILRTSMEELVRCGVVDGSQNDFFKAVIYRKLSSSSPAEQDGVLSEVLRQSQELMNVAEVCQGLSGRTLRKIPFLTSTRFCSDEKPSLNTFLTVMGEVAEKFKLDNNQFFGVFDQGDSDK